MLETFCQSLSTSSTNVVIHEAVLSIDAWEIRFEGWGLPFLNETSVTGTCNTVCFATATNR
jgi:hypothetical protein